MDKFELWLRRRVCGVVLVTCEVVDDDDTRDFIFVAAVVILLVVGEEPMVEYEMRDR